MKRWVVGFACVSVLWPLIVAAQPAGIRMGSLEFEVLEGPDPVGLVALLFIPDAAPSITYQIPQSPGGHFTTPWAVTIGGGKVGTDTLIVLTNADVVATVSMKVRLWNAAGVLDDGCTRTLILEPKATVKKATRSLFPGCPALLP